LILQRIGQLNDALSICQEVFLELVAYKDQIDALQLVDALLSYFQSPKGLNERILLVVDEANTLAGGDFQWRSNEDIEKSRTTTTITPSRPIASLIISRFTCSLTCRVPVFF